MINGDLASGKHTKTMENHKFLMGKFTMSMVIFHSYVKLPEGTWMVIVKVTVYTGKS